MEEIKFCDGPTTFEREALQINKIYVLNPFFALGHTEFHIIS